MRTTDGFIICGKAGIDVRILDAPGGRRLCLVTTSDHEAGAILVNLENRAAEALADKISEGLRIIRARHGHD